jgi:DnaJ like chaperone protein
MAIRGTHIWSYLFIPVIWFTRLFSVYCFIYLFIDVFKWHGFFGIVGFVLGLFVHYLTLDQLYILLHTHLYINLSLRTKTNLKESWFFSLLFSPNETGRWYPLEQIKKIDKEKRKVELFLAARQIYKEIGHNPQIPESLIELANEYSKNRKNIIFPGFDHLVGMLCKLSKADNHISDSEIELIDSFFTHTLKLDEEHRKDAIEMFNKAKISTVTFEQFANSFKDIHVDSPDFLGIVFKLLVELAFADGYLSAEEEILLHLASTIFGINNYKSPHDPDPTGESELKYKKVMGINGEYTKESLKKKYRKLATEYHPDKVAHLGDKMKEVAEREMKEINEAYEYLNNKCA